MLATTVLGCLASGGAAATAGITGMEDTRTSGMSTTGITNTTIITNIKIITIITNITLITNTTIIIMAAAITTIIPITPVMVIMPIMVTTTVMAITTAVDIKRVAGTTVARRKSSDGFGLAPMHSPVLSALTMTERHFPPSWTVEKIPPSFSRLLI
jgi:hypothetical protein